MRGVHLLGKSAEGLLQGLCVAGQLLKGFHADSSTPSSCYSVWLPLQSSHSRLQGFQLCLALVLQRLWIHSVSQHSTAQQ